jgi:Alpha/beta hydrolase family
MMTTNPTRSSWSRDNLFAQRVPDEIVGHRPSVKKGVTRVGPFAQRWIERGVGPRVLLLHGIYAGANGDEWARLVPQLRAQRTVRVPDLLGCGTSDRPDLEYTPEVLLAAVDTLIRDAGPDVHVVASSLTGAYVVRAIREGAPVSRLTLITPTGLGRAQAHPAWAAAGFVYALGRHTPIGDIITQILGSKWSVRWFLERQAYGDRRKVTDAAVDSYHRATHQRNAKHLALAFVFGRLALALDDTEVKACEPDVLWAGADGFSPRADAQAWSDARAHVVIFEGVGLPQAEVPELVADLVLGDWREEAIGRRHSDGPPCPPR